MLNNVVERGDNTLCVTCDGERHTHHMQHVRLARFLVDLVYMGRGCERDRLSEGDSHICVLLAATSIQNCRALFRFNLAWRQEFR